MKTTVFAALAIASLAGAAQADLIASWSFNNIPAIGTAGTPVALGITSIAATDGSGTASLAGWNGNIDDFAGSTINAYGADVAGASLSLISGGSAAPFPGNGGSVTFNASLTGFENPVITYATRGTSTGFSIVQFAWSTDGVNFTDFGAAYSATTTTFFLVTYDLTAINALDGVASATFRLTFSGATSSSGNNRLDNFQINAAAIPTPSAAALMGMGLLASARRRRA
ncbi:MAG: hypothetical protein Q8L55_02045 [Phycisphaerales bacterium]|nr:hypothetical protein [Phycisphaerales bacterium]